MLDGVEEDQDRAFIDACPGATYAQRPDPNHQPDDEQVVVSIRPIAMSAMGA